MRIADDALAGGVLLIGFRKQPLPFFSKLWLLLRWYLLWQIPEKCFCEFVGKVNTNEVWFLELPWQEEEFAHFNFEKQRFILCKILLKAKRAGACIAGMPMVWREVLGARAPLHVADGRMLSFKVLLQQIKTEYPNARDIAVLGMDARWTRDIAPYMVRQGLNPILSGTMAAAISESLYRKEGLAVAALQPIRASEQAELSISLKPTTAGGLSGDVVLFKEATVALEGAWYGPYFEGVFPAAMAEAILTIGGQIKETACAGSTA